MVEQLASHSILEAVIRKPLLQALVWPGLEGAFGIEVDAIKVHKAEAFLKLTVGELQEKGVLSQHLAQPEIRHSLIEQVTTLDPFTHAYSFWDGIPPAGKAAFGRLFAASSTLQAVAVVQHAMRGNPEEAMLQLGFGPVELVDTLTVRMSGLVVQLRSPPVLSTCPVAVSGGAVEHLAVLRSSNGELWAPGTDTQSLLLEVGVDAAWVSKLARKVARKATVQERSLLDTLQVAAFSASVAVETLLPLARLVKELHSSPQTLAAQCLACSIDLQLQAVSRPVTVPRSTPAQLYVPESLVKLAHYGMGSVSGGHGQLAEGSRLGTELLLLGHHLREDGHLVLRFFAFLRARRAAVSTLELHAKSALAVVNFLRRAALGADQDELDRLEQWYQQVRQSFVQEGAAIPRSADNKQPHPGLIIHHVTSRMEEAFRAAKAGELLGKKAKAAQAALLLGLLGFAYGPPVRSNAVRELVLLPPKWLAEEGAELVELQRQHEHLLKQLGRPAWSSRKQQEQQEMERQAANIESRALSLRTCTHSTDCRDPFCLGNRVEVVRRGIKQLVQFRIVHHKTEGSHGEQVVLHSDPVFQQLARWWIQTGRGQLAAPDTLALFINDRGQPFPTSRTFSSYLKPACWDVAGEDVCSRSVRKTYVTGIRDFLDMRPEAVRAAEKGLASMMLTSVARWSTNYDARSKGDREYRLACQAHEAFR
ncbi:hypothetical protein N2152v2_001147 [Parachlorella kessleri]